MRQVYHIVPCPLRLAEHAQADEQTSAHHAIELKQSTNYRAASTPANAANVANAANAHHR